MMVVIHGRQRTIGQINNPNMARKVELPKEKIFISLILQFAANNITLHTNWIETEHSGDIYYLSDEQKLGFEN